MLVKTHGIKSGDGSKAVGYVQELRDNIEIEVLDGDPDAQLVADDFGQISGHKNGLIHQTINPDRPITREELTKIYREMDEALGMNPNDPHLIVRHQSMRNNGEILDHYHRIRPAADTETGKAYKLFRSNKVDEAVSRKIEIDLGHDIVPGAHNDFAHKWLTERGLTDHAKIIEPLINDKPVADYTANENARFKRLDFDKRLYLNGLKGVAELPAEQQPAAFAELITQFDGLEVAQGDKRSRIELRKDGDLLYTASNRTLSVKARDVAAFIAETQEHIDERIRLTAGAPGTNTAGTGGPDDRAGIEPGTGANLRAGTDAGAGIERSADASDQKGYGTDLGDNRARGRGESATRDLRADANAARPDRSKAELTEDDFADIALQTVRFQADPKAHDLRDAFKSKAELALQREIDDHIDKTIAAARSRAKLLSGGDQLLHMKHAQQLMLRRFEVRKELTEKLEHIVPALNREQSYKSYLEGLSGPEYAKKQELLNAKDGGDRNTDLKWARINAIERVDKRIDKLKFEENEIYHAAGAASWAVTPTDEARSYLGLDDLDVVERIELRNIIKIERQKRDLEHQRSELVPDFNETKIAELNDEIRRLETTLVDRLSSPGGRDLRASVQSQQLIAKIDNAESSALAERVKQRNLDAAIADIIASDNPQEALDREKLLRPKMAPDLDRLYDKRMTEAAFGVSPEEAEKKRVLHDLEQRREAFVIEMRDASSLADLTALGQRIGIIDAEIEAIERGDNDPAADNNFEREYDAEKIIESREGVRGADGSRGSRGSQEGRDQRDIGALGADAAQSGSPDRASASDVWSNGAATGNGRTHTPGAQSSVEAPARDREGNSAAVLMLNDAARIVKPLKQNLRRSTRHFRGSGGSAPANPVAPQPPPDMSAPGAAERALQAWSNQMRAINNANEQIRQATAYVPPAPKM